MKLQPGWRFGDPGGLEMPVVHRFSDLIGLIASQAGRRSTFEHFKKSFAGPAGRQYAFSSSDSWAESDLEEYMRGAASNAPLFIEAFVDGCKALASDDVDTPDETVINRILAEFQTGYRIQADTLLSTDPHQHLSTASAVPASLDEEGRKLVLESFELSSRLFEEGRHRQAVQELLWLLETVTTAFRGLGDGDRSIKGKYFNEIARSLRQREHGTIFEQVLNWMGTMHGYLSAPAGGGIRHGRDLNKGIEMSPNDAVLIANLIRSYIQYLMTEHQRISGAT